MAFLNVLSSYTMNDNDSQSSMTFLMTSIMFFFFNFIFKGHGETEEKGGGTERVDGIRREKKTIQFNEG